MVKYCYTQNATLNGFCQNKYVKNLVRPRKPNAIIIIIIIIVSIGSKAPNTYFVIKPAKRHNIYITCVVIELQIKSSFDQICQVSIYNY